MAMQGYVRGQCTRDRETFQIMNHQLFMSRKNSAVVSFRWLPASIFCSCFTRSSLSVVPRQLNWCSKCWSRSLSSWSMVAVSRPAKLFTILHVTTFTTCQRATLSLRTFSFCYLLIVVFSAVNFKCHSPYDVRLCTFYTMHAYLRHQSSSVTNFWKSGRQRPENKDLVFFSDFLLKIFFF